MKIEKIEIKTPYTSTITNAKTGLSYEKPMEKVELALAIDGTVISLGTSIFETGLGINGKSRFIMGNKNLWTILNKISDDLVEASKRFIAPSIIHLTYKDREIFSSKEQIEEGIKKGDGYPDFVVGFFFDNENNIQEIYNHSFFADLIRSYIQETNESKASTSLEQCTKSAKR